ncbi:hypothetical protein GEOBC_00612 [Geobacteraceae bacterium]|nr:hypothetical protein GEOBC_00612 [Geobacteraceae bacterium]
MIQIIVPPRQDGGVFDFACQLRDALGLDVTALVHLAKATAAGWEVGPTDVVVLQLSGYGFSKRGAPLWLLHELEERRKHIKTLGVFFHELYAFGPPWSSSFWLSPVQRHIARRLAELSDFWMTNREGSAGWLRRYAGGKPHAVLPVFSTIGEPDTFAQVRLPRIIVFGSPGLRRATYQAAGDRLFTWARQASLELHDIGAPIQDVRLNAAFQANRVVQHGRLADHEIRILMGNALFGLVAYPVEYVAKSSVFAAYCAHGLCPILFSEKYYVTDGLILGEHYLRDIPGASGLADYHSIRKAAWLWYQAHNLSRHQTTIKDLIMQSQACSC